jgi:uncharacterized Zn finger protein
VAKKSDEGWQPLLLDVGAPKKSEQPKQAELRVEYDPLPRGQVKPVEAPAASPWWQRVRQVETDPVKVAQPVLSWGGSWIRLLAGEGWLDELRASRRALLEHSVRGLEVRPGVIEAGVGGGKARPERVQLRFAPLTSGEWARLARQVIDDGTDEAVGTALDSGHVPVALVDAADRHGVPILPKRLVLLVAACTCGGARLPCDHVLAVHLALAKKLEGEPLALLAFRGGQPKELLELFARVREELRATLPAARIEVDPFAPGDAPEPDWTLLARPSMQRAPLPPPEGWRARESIDALVRRVVAAVRQA